MQDTRIIEHGGADKGELPLSPNYCLVCGNLSFQWRLSCWRCFSCDPPTVPSVRYLKSKTEPVYTGGREVYEARLLFWTPAEVLAAWPATFTPPFPTGAAVGAVRLQKRKITGVPSEQIK